MESRPDAIESFEQIYEQLQQKVSGLERGGLTLEQSLAYFEEGMQLADRCMQLLEQAQLRVTKLVADGEASADADGQ